jgi:hypothetical protein
MAEDDNKKNLLYFEGSTMRGLYDVMAAWQDEHKKRLMSVSMQVTVMGGRLSVHSF